MRMLLTSNGVSDDRLSDTLLNLVGKSFSDSRIVVIIDAILPFSGGKSQLLAHLAQLQSLGWERFDVLSLLAVPPASIESRLRSADVILGYGGSNHWLAHAWTASGAASLLRDLLEEKVYVGWSAGSMIFSCRQADAVAAFDDQDEVAMLGLETVAPALPLFEWFVMPHLGAPYMPQQTDQWAAASSTRLEGGIWHIDDATALLIRDPAVEPEVVSSGHWLHYVDGRLVGSR